MAKYIFFLALFSSVLGSAIPSAKDHDLCSRNVGANFSTYAPVRVQCPNRSEWVRPANGLSEEETVWVHHRKQKVLKEMASYLGHLQLEDFDLDDYLKRLGCDTSNVPTLGMAISGGAWSSAMTGTAALRAFDARFPPSMQQRTGGILQSLTYLAGLSGGSWPVMSLATYNYPTINDMVAYWHTGLNTVGASNRTAHRATAEEIFEQMAPKFEAGFNLSFADWMGRAVSYEYVAGANGGMATTVSGIAQLSNFKNHEMPLPMWQASEGTSNDVKYYNISVPFYNATIFEWSPLEFGAWNGPKSFFPTKYLGTKVVDGAPVGECIVGFDRASFMLGAAADAWNFWWLEDLSNNTIGSFSKRQEPRSRSAIQRRGIDWAPSSFPIAVLKGLAKVFQKNFGYTYLEAMYVTVPNPFASKASVDNNSDPPQNLTLIDESEAGQSLPLWSLIQPARKADFIVAWDADGDAKPYMWLNGTNMYNTYIYATNNGVPFPIVPKPATFIKRNYTYKPTFFGCEASLTNTQDTRAPIVLYLPNAPYSTYSNYSAFTPSYTHEQMAVILTNGFNEVTQGNGTLDSEWPECLGCAAIDRSLARVGMKRTEQCQRCMTKYCWDGQEEDSDQHPIVVDIPMVLDPSYTFAKWNASLPYWGEAPEQN